MTLSGNNNCRRSILQQIQPAALPAVQTGVGCVCHKLHTQRSVRLQRPRTDYPAGLAVGSDLNNRLDVLPDILFQQQFFVFRQVLFPRGSPHNLYIVAAVPAASV